MTFLIYFHNSNILEKYSALERNEKEDNYYQQITQVLNKDLINFYCIKNLTLQLFTL